MEWTEINCIIAALESLIEKQKGLLGRNGLTDDERADVSNDLAYAEILLGKYEAMRSEAAEG